MRGGLGVRMRNGLGVDLQELPPLRIGVFDFYGQVCQTANSWSCQLLDNTTDPLITSVASTPTVMQRGLSTFKHVTVSGACRMPSNPH